MSGRGKGKTAKKAVSQSSKAGLQFPVGRVARCEIPPALWLSQNGESRLQPAAVSLRPCTLHAGTEMQQLVTVHASRMISIHT